AILLERLAAGVAGVEVVPVADPVLLGLDPAQVHLLIVAPRGEVDETAVEVAQDHVALAQRGRGLAQLEEGLRHGPAGVAAAVAGHRSGERVAGVLVQQAVARLAHPRQRLRHPVQRRRRLLQRVVAGVPHRTRAYAPPAVSRRAAGPGGPRTRRSSRSRAARPGRPRFALPGTPPPAGPRRREPT